jgi:hypothetical protein
MSRETAALDTPPSPPAYYVEEVCHGFSASESKHLIAALRDADREPPEPPEHVEEPQSPVPPMGWLADDGSAGVVVQSRARHWHPAWYADSGSNGTPIWFEHIDTIVAKGDITSESREDNKL